MNWAVELSWLAMRNQVKVLIAKTDSHIQTSILGWYAQAYIYGKIPNQNINFVKLIKT